MAGEPLLSVVVTAYTMERLDYIRELLDGIKVQTYPRVETIFVVERSRELLDQIRGYAEEKVIPGVKVIFNEGENGASAARNLGITQAMGDIIAFLDDDAVAFPDWAEEIVATYGDNSIIGVTGPALPLWENEGMAWFPDELSWLISCTSWLECRELSPMRNIWLQNGSFRREAFTTAGLLNVGLGPQDSVQGFKGRELKNGVISEEVELSLRVRAATGKAIVYNPRVRVRHRVEARRLKSSYIRQWSYWTGYSKHKLKRLYPQAGADTFQQEHRLLGRILRRLVPNIMKTFLTHPVVAWRRLKVTVTALLFVALGYYSHFGRCLIFGQRREQLANKHAGEAV